MKKTRLLSAILAFAMFFCLFFSVALPAHAAGGTVTFCLIGAERGENGEYVVWIPEGEYPVNKLSHVGTVLKKAADAAGLTLTGLESNYISAITAPEALGGYELAEFTNGPYSGWMYTVNGTHPGRGVNARYLADGDVVVFHYVNDYRYEVEDWSGGSSLGTEEDWNHWLDADDSWLEEEEEEGLRPPAEDETPEENEPEQTPPPEDLPEDTEEDMSSAAAEDVAAAIDALTVSKANAKTGKRLKNIRNAYDLLSDEEQAQVNNLDTLEEMEDTFAELLDEAREDAEEDLEDLADKLTDGCTKEQRQDIEDILDEALEDLEDADDTDEIDEIVDDAEADMKKAAGEETEEAPAPVDISFADTNGNDWFYEDVAFVVGEGLFNGTSDTAFSPHISMNRAMLVTVLYRLEGEPAVSATAAFSDVEPDQWYTDAVSWASDNGIVSGYGGGAFGTDDPVTREQLAAILYRYAAKQLVDVSLTADLTGFADCGTISTYATAAMGWANAAGLLNGRTEDTLAPLGTATRAEVAAIIHRFAESF